MRVGYCVINNGRRNRSRCFSRINKSASMEAFKSSELPESLNLSVPEFHHEFRTTKSSSQTARRPNRSASTRESKIDHLMSSEILRSLDLSLVPENHARTIFPSPPTDSPPRPFRHCLLDLSDLSEFLPHDPLQETCSGSSALLSLIAGPTANGAILNTCLLCSLVDEHGDLECPYQSFIPKNATASRCDIVCKVCGQLFSGRCCNQDAGRAILRYCYDCFMLGDHWASQCPKEKRSYPDNMCI